MKQGFFFSFLFCVMLLTDCKHKEAAAGAVSPAQTLTIKMFPSWGGSAEAILERKNGKNNLYSTYHEKINGADTTVTQITSVDIAAADSIFALAEKVNWNADANRGTADEHTGLRFEMALKKGRTEKSVSWENLKNAGELPVDILQVIQPVNRLSPEYFKLY